jgi:hypothetical protein
MDLSCDARNVDHGKVCRGMVVTVLSTAGGEVMAKELNKREIYDERRMVIGNWRLETGAERSDECQ